MSKKDQDSLRQSINKLRTQNEGVFNELEKLAAKVESLENNDGNRQAQFRAMEKTQASMEMRLRDLEIKFRSKQGEKHVDLAREYGLSEGRISQIAK